MTDTAAPNTPTTTPTATDASASTAGLPAAPVATDATAPATTETPDPKFHKAWKGLAAAEKANVERAKALSASEKKVAQWEQVFAIEDPVARVEALAELSGKKDLFNAAAMAMVSRKKVDPNVSRVQTEVEVLRAELTVAHALPLISQGMDPADVARELGVDEAALSALYNDKKHGPRLDAAAKKYADGIAAKLGDSAAQTAAWVAAAKEPDGSPTYELIDAHGYGHKVFELIEAHHRDTFDAGDPVILTPKEAADLIEEALEEHSRPLLQKLSTSRRMKAVAPTTADKQPVQPSPASRPTSPKTLGNVASQDSSASPLPKSASEREREAIKVLDAIHAARKAQ